MNKQLEYNNLTEYKNIANDTYNKMYKEYSNSMDKVGYIINDGNIYNAFKKISKTVSDKLFEIEKKLEEAKNNNSGPLIANLIAEGLGYEMFKNFIEREKHEMGIKNGMTSKSDFKNIYTEDEIRNIEAQRIIRSPKFQDILLETLAGYEVKIADANLILLNYTTIEQRNDFIKVMYERLFGIIACTYKEFERHFYDNGTEFLMSYWGTGEAELKALFDYLYNKEIIKNKRTTKLVCQHFIADDGSYFKESQIGQMGTRDAYHSIVDFDSKKLKGKTIFELDETYQNPFVDLFLDLERIKSKSY